MKNSHKKCGNGKKLTLKQMKNENGMVTRTSSQQMMVKIHPHTPMPVSLSPASLLSFLFFVFFRKRKKKIRRRRKCQKTISNREIKVEQTTIDIAAKLRRDFSFDDDRVQHFRGLDQLNNQLVDGLCRNKREDGAIIIQRAATRAPTNCLYPWPSRCLLYPSEQRNVTPGQVPSPCHIGPPWPMDDPCDGRRHCVCVYDEAVRNDTLPRRQKDETLVYFC